MNEPCPTCGHRPIRFETKAERKVAKKLRRINAIFDGDHSWKAKFDLIFDNYGPRKMRGLKPMKEFSYYDPDMDYEDDIRAYVQALNEFWNRRFSNDC